MNTKKFELKIGRTAQTFQVYCLCTELTKTKIDETRKFMEPYYSIITKLEIIWIFLNNNCLAR